MTAPSGWTRVLMADGSVPPEVRRALRIEGAQVWGHAPPRPILLPAEVVDARWPEDAP